MPIEIKITITEDPPGVLHTSVTANSPGTMMEAKMGQVMARACMYAAEWIGERNSQQESVILKDQIDIMPLEEGK